MAMIKPFVTKGVKDGGFSSWLSSHVFVAAILNFVMAYACIIDYTNPRAPCHFTFHTTLVCI